MKGDGDGPRFSLLFPDGEEAAATGAGRSLPADAVEDLGIREIAATLAGRGFRETDAIRILTDLQTDAATIQFRQDILADFLSAGVSATAVEKLLKQIEELVFFSDTRKSSESDLLRAIWRLGELELYVECVDTLHDLLAGRFQIQSSGLRGLAERLNAIRETDEFAGMKTELPELREGLLKRRSVTIGVNLDERLRPVEATLLSINSSRFEEGSLLGRLFGAFGDRREFKTYTPMHATPAGGTEPGTDFPLSPLFQDIELLLRSLAHPIAETLKSYLRVHTGFMRTLAPEISFYLGAARLLGTLRDHGLPICKPRILPVEDRVTDLNGFYNLQLALRRIRESRKESSELRIVSNDLQMTGQGRVFLLTGPNQGGKTTFIQGVGIAQVLAQTGLFVPAQQASISPADRVLTHFPVGEKGQITTGRLAEEAERFAAIFDTVTPRSLVLMNESLSSTSPGEGLYLAEDIVRAMRLLGVRALFATHLHELVSRVVVNESADEASDPLSRIVSLVAETDRNDLSHHRRTYRVVPGPPTGKSFAGDVADQFGISYAALERRLKDRGLL